MHEQKLRAILVALVYTLGLAGCATPRGGGHGEPYDLANRYESRAITFENPEERRAAEARRPTTSAPDARARPARCFRRERRSRCATSRVPARSATFG